MKGRKAREEREKGDISIKASITISAYVSNLLSPNTLSGLGKSYMPLSASSSRTPFVSFG